MGLLITAYLILTNMSTSAKAFDAKVFTAMDAWFYACRFFVGAALFEFAMVIKLISKLPTGGEQEESSTESTLAYDRYRVYDSLAFWIFGATFIVFCFVYGGICFSH